MSPEFPISQSGIRQEKCVSSSRHQWDILPYGSAHYIKHKLSGFCLDVPYSSTADGVQLWLWPCNYDTAQLFSVPACAECWGEIRNLNSNKCVDLQYSGRADGTPIWQWPCNSGRAQQWYTDVHNPENYEVSSGRWYQFYEDTYNYTTWMTLSAHRHVGTYGSQYNQPINEALTDWNSPGIAPNTVYFSEYATPADSHDVHIAVVSDCYTHSGLSSCTGDALGRADAFDQAKHICSAFLCSHTGPGHSRPHTFWYMQVLIDYEATVNGNKRQVVAHELGHAVAGLPDLQFGNCTPRPRIMDYGCLTQGVYRPQPFDTCGINHAYYDPNWGFSGC